MKKIILLITLLTLYFTSLNIQAQISVTSDTVNQEIYGRYTGTPIIKLSSSYMCHDKNSPYYSRTLNGYRNNFSTIQECVNAGFGLPNVSEYREEPEFYAKGAANIKALQEARLLTKDDPAKAILDGLGSTANQTPNSVPATESQIETAKEEVEKANKEKEASFEFGGFNWNPALVYLSYNGHDYIEDVRIESGEEGEPSSIFVGKQISGQLSLMLEAHYYWDWMRGKYQYGTGPFVSVSLATQEGNSLGSVTGVGWMFGLRQQEGISMNIGLGYFRDTDFVTLRDGLKDGDETTFTDSNDLLQKRDNGGLMLVLSSTF